MEEVTQFADKSARDVTIDEAINTPGYIKAMSSMKEHARTIKQMSDQVMAYISQDNKLRAGYTLAQIISLAEEIENSQWVD